MDCAGGAAAYGDWDGALHGICGDWQDVGVGVIDCSIPSRANAFVIRWAVGNQTAHVNPFPIAFI